MKKLLSKGDVKGGRLVCVNGTMYVVIGKTEKMRK